VALLTVAVNCADWLSPTLAVFGEMKMVNCAALAVRGFATNAATHRTDKKRSGVLIIFLMAFTLGLLKSDFHAMWGVPPHIMLIGLSGAEHNSTSVMEKPRAAAGGKAETAEGRGESAPSR
jgi:hypothetical protein